MNASPTVRVGAIDVGSNALRFCAAVCATGGNARVLEQLRTPLRLGHDVFQRGRLQAETLTAALAALAHFQERSARHRLQRCRAVATSAVRDAANGGELIEAVRQRTGLVLECITAAEEARLVFLAVRQRLGLGQQPWLLVDLGGGSLEISLVSAAGIARTESFPLGSVRLLEGIDPATADLAAAIEPQLRTLDRAALLREPHAGLIATGGNIEALAQLCEPGATPAIAVAGVRDCAAQLARLGVAERGRRFNLRPDRADVIVPAALVYLRIAERAGAHLIHVPRVGVKEGILAELCGRGAVDGVTP